MIKKMMFICGMVFMSVFSVYAQEPEKPQADNSGLAIFLNAGLGIAYNVYLEDAQNELVDKLAGFTEIDDQSKGAWGYGTIGFEPRYFSGNLVYGMPVAYYNVSDSKRAAVNGPLIYESEIILDVWSVSFIVNYKIDMPDSNYLLLGGGLGLYIGTIEWNFAGSVDKDTKWTIGWQTGIEYHWVWGNVDIYTGVTSRFAEILNFKVHSDDGKSNMIAGLTGISFNLGAGYRY